VKNQSTGKFAKKHVLKMSGPNQGNYSLHYKNSCQELAKYCGDGYNGVPVYASCGLETRPYEYRTIQYTKQCPDRCNQKKHMPLDEQNMRSTQQWTHGQDTSSDDDSRDYNSQTYIGDTSSEGD
jgi:hypothetical protein